MMPYSAPHLWNSGDDFHLRNIDFQQTGMVVPLLRNIQLLSNILYLCQIKDNTMVLEWPSFQWAVDRIFGWQIHFQRLIIFSILLPQKIVKNQRKEAPLQMLLLQINCLFCYLVSELISFSKLPMNYISVWKSGVNWKSKFQFSKKLSALQK